MDISNIKRLLIEGRYVHGKEGERQDVWTGGLPTIQDGDTNPNPIQERVNENGVTEYFRKLE